MILLLLFGRGAGGGGGQFRVDPDSVRSDADGIKASVTPGDGGGSALSLSVRFYANGVCRLKVDEPPPAAQRWEVRGWTRSLKQGYVLPRVVFYCQYRVCVCVTTSPFVTRTYVQHAGEVADLGSHSICS